MSYGLKMKRFRALALVLAPAHPQSLSVARPLAYGAHVDASPVAAARCEEPDGHGSGSEPQAEAAVADTVAVGCRRR